MSLKVKFMHECLAHQVVLTPSMKELKLNSEEVKHGNFLRFILFAVKRKNVAGVLFADWRFSAYGIKLFRSSSLPFR